MPKRQQRNLEGSLIKLNQRGNPLLVELKSSISRAKLIPENATIRKEYVKCGKTPCYHGKHGPYYYAYWKDPETKKLKKKYIGPHQKGKSKRQ